MVPGPQPGVGPHHAWRRRSVFAGAAASVPTKKLHLAALGNSSSLVVRHVVIVNSASTVRAERYQVVEGKTPEISPKQARKLLGAIEITNLVGLRDRAVIAVLIDTAARVGRVSRLTFRASSTTGPNTHSGSRKRRNSREIPVRHDVELFLLENVQAAGIQDGPLFARRPKDESSTRTP